MAKKSTDKLTAEQMRLVISEQSNDIADMKKRLAVLEQREQPVTGAVTSGTTEDSIKEVVRKEVVRIMQEEYLQISTTYVELDDKSRKSLAETLHSRLNDGFNQRYKSLAERVSALEARPATPMVIKQEQADIPTPRQNHFCWRWLLYPLYPLWWICLAYWYGWEYLRNWCKLFFTAELYRKNDTYILYFIVFGIFFAFLIPYLASKFI